MQELKTYVGTGNSYKTIDFSNIQIPTNDVASVTNIHSELLALTTSLKSLEEQVASLQSKLYPVSKENPVRGDVVAKVQEPLSPLGIELRKLKDLSDTLNAKLYDIIDNIDL